MTGRSGQPILANDKFRAFSHCTPLGKIMGNKEEKR